MPANIVQVSIENTVPVLTVDINNTTTVVEVNLETPVIRATLESTPVIEVTAAQRGPAGPAGADSTIPGPQGEPGPKGDDGTAGLPAELVGTFDTANALTSAYPSPQDNYWAFVKDPDPLVLHIARPDTSGWVSEAITLVQGPKGDDGNTGASGSNGQDGADGLSAYELAVQNGYVGGEVDWLASLAGADGQDGQDGSNGSPGATGLSAYELAVANGFVGSQSEWLTSLIGTDGADGQDGTDGSDGLSAYEVAVAKGFVGNEAQWLLSLVGPAGSNGADGADGTSVKIIGAVDNYNLLPGYPNSYTGDTGDGYLDASGNLWVWTGTAWQDVGNIQGPAGADGADGSNGINGASAYELAVENGFSGTEAEWLLSLKGTDGADGQDGSNGTNGATAYELAVANGFSGSEVQWLASLVGADGQDGSNGTNGSSAYELAVANGFSGTQSEWLLSLVGADGSNGTNGISITDFDIVNGDFIVTLSDASTINAGALNLADLSDVAFVGTPSTGQVLKYDADSGLWYNGSDQTGGGGGGLSYTDFSVGTPNTASGSGAISYNNTNGVFKYTPPDLSGYLTGITSLQVTNALGYTPYSSSNPNNYTSNTGTVTSIATSGSVNGITLTGGTITSSGTITLGGTLSGIANNQLTNSSVTVNGTSISLGASGTITATATNALTIGTGLGGTSYNGSTAVTITNTDTGSAQNIFKTVAVSGQTSVTAASNTATLTLVAGTGIALTTDNTAKSVTITANGGSPTFTNVTVTGQIIEPFQTYNTAITGTPSITFNCAGGNIWLVNPSGGPSTAWTANFTNVQVTTNQATNITMIVVEGSTPFIPSAISINGTAVSVTWQGGTAPTVSANKTEAVGYSVLQTGASTYTVLGQMVTFG